MKKTVAFRKEMTKIIRSSLPTSALASALEQLSIKTFGPAEDAESDGFDPPAEPRLVSCTHCGSTYSSVEIVRQYRPHLQHAAVSMLGEEFDRLDPLWWCKEVTCDGAGYQFDLVPAQGGAA